MKDIRWLLFLIVSILLLVLLYFVSSQFLVFDICLFFVFIIPVTIYLFLNSNNLNISEITISNISDNKIRFSYEDICYELDIDEFYKKPKIDKFDSNSRKVGLLTRYRIKKFLSKDYTKEDIKDEIKLISDEQIMEKISGFKECDDETKERLADLLHSSLIYVVFMIILLVLLLITLKPLIYNIQHGYFEMLSVWVISALVFLLFITFIINRDLHTKTKNANVYYKEMYVYRKKIEKSDDTVCYYFRLWDKEKHVLYKWFSVDGYDYKKEIGTPVIVYIIDVPKDRYIHFEFKDEKKED